MAMRGLLRRQARGAGHRLVANSSNPQVFVRTFAGSWPGLA